MLHCDILLEISEDEPDHDRNVVDPNYGPHEQLTPPPSKLKHTPLDIPREHDSPAGTGLAPMERFVAMSTIDEPWPMYASNQMAGMGIEEGDLKTALRRSIAAQSVAGTNGQPIASSDALNECSRIQSGTQSLSRIQKKQRLVRRSPSRRPRSNGD